MTHFNTKHGHAGRRRKTRTYRLWEAMHRRCSMPSQQSYPLYGGRGIRVCDRWRSFESFLADMGECPEQGSLDRINGDGHYEPGNCRWASQKQQQRNRRGNRLIEHDGVTATVAEWAERTGVPSATIRARIDRYGWSAGQALTAPHRTPAESARAASLLRWGRDLTQARALVDLHQGPAPASDKAA
jgi:hypothetical protein